MSRVTCHACLPPNLCGGHVTVPGRCGVGQARLRLPARGGLRSQRQGSQKGPTKWEKEFLESEYGFPNKPQTYSTRQRACPQACHAQRKESPSTGCPSLWQSPHQNTFSRRFRVTVGMMICTLCDCWPGKGRANIQTLHVRTQPGCARRDATTRGCGRQSAGVETRETCFLAVSSRTF